MAREEEGVEYEWEGEVKPHAPRGLHTPVRACKERWCTVTALSDMYKPRHVQRKVGEGSGDKKREEKIVIESSTKKGGEGKQKVHNEVQQKRNKKQASKHLKYIKPFILGCRIGELTVQKTTINALCFQRKPKEKA
jgi:hypothetical protein